MAAWVGRGCTALHWLHTPCCLDMEMVNTTKFGLRSHLRTSEYELIVLLRVSIKQSSLHDKNDPLKLYLGWVDFEDAATPKSP